MVILMLLEHTFPGDVRVDKEVQSLFEAGHRVIVASTTMGSMPEVEQAGNCTIYRKQISPFINKSSVAALRFPIYFNFWRSFLNKIIKEERVDAIHVHDLPLAQVGLELKRKYGVKLVIDLHENYPALLEISQHTKTLLGKLLSSNKQWRRYEAKMAKNADAIVTVVQEMKNRICNLTVDPNKVYVVENTPLLSETIIEKNIDANFFTITYIGGITEARGLQYVLEGFAIILKNKKNARLWIAGDGKYLNHLKAMANQLGIHENVKFFGKVARTVTVDMLSKTDIAVIPHVRSEQSDNSSPNKLYEYMDIGVPALVSNCISVERVTKEAGAGLSYIHNSPKDFAEQLLKVIDKPDTLFAYGENGKKALLTKYNWQQSSQELIRLYSNFSL